MRDFPHERLTVYRTAIRFVGWTTAFLANMPTKVAVHDQLDRASTSIPLNIAEGNAKASAKDRARFWQIALGSTVECAACLDVAVARGLCDATAIAEGRATLLEVSAMLGKMLQNLGTMIAEVESAYGDEVCQVAEEM